VFADGWTLEAAEELGVFDAEARGLLVALFSRLIVTHGVATAHCPDVRCDDDAADSLCSLAAAPCATNDGHATLCAHERLTARELEVAELIARGLTNRQIAGELVITPWTAASHVVHILRKLGFRSRAQVADWVGMQRTRAVASLD
jgi:DNA-binding NarL/FixJ family response regulator